MARISAASHEIIPRSGEQAALGDCSAPVAGAADALQTDRDCARRADLADQVDTADIDSSSSDASGTRARISPALSLRSALRRNLRERLP